ncbi:helix-turn-helix transcriptional regulator [Limnohabitans sp.]
MQTTQQTPQLLTLKQIVGDSKKGIVALIPVSRSTFENRVKTGKYPKPVKLTERLNAWRVDDINRLIESMGQHDWATV